MTCTRCRDIEIDQNGSAVYVYRCSRCGGCYGCEHEVSRDYRSWKCKDGNWRPVIFDRGVTVASFSGKDSRL